MYLKSPRCKTEATQPDAHAHTHTKTQAHRHRHIQRFEMLIARDHKTHTEERVSKRKKIEMHENTVDENNPPPKTDPPPRFEAQRGGGYY